MPYTCYARAVRQNRFKPGKTQEKSAPSAVAAGYINRAATAITITTVLRSLQSTSRCRDGSKFCKYIIFVCITIVLRSLHTYFVASLATMKYTCSKCNKVFGKKYNMLRHERTACNSTTTTVSPPSVCSKCGKVFGKKHHLQRHETTCVVSPPLPKRPKREDTTPRHPFISEDPIGPPDRFPFPDALSTDLLEVIRNNWSSIRTRVSRGPLQTRVNYRLTTLDTTDLHPPLYRMFQEQTNAFKINLSYGFVLKNKHTGCYRYYHSSCNCCGRYLDEPNLITDRGDFDEFLERIKQNDILQWALSQRPDSAWVCELVTNVTFLLIKS